MFARYFVEIAAPADRVEAMLVDRPEVWLPGLAQRASLRGDELLAEVGFGERIRVARPVSVAIAAPIRMGSRTVIPMRWVPSGMSGLFPSLDADLEIASLGVGRTKLAMSARYAPPLGPVGRALDKVVLFRVAEATLKAFLDGVAVSLSSPEHSVEGRVVEDAAQPVAAQPAQPSPQPPPPPIGPATIAR